MQSEILIQKLANMGLTLPEPTKPGGNYQPVNIRGMIAYISIQFPIRNGAFMYQGVLGMDMDAAEGYSAMQLCALNVIAQVNDKIGWQYVEGINHLDIGMQMVEGWTGMPGVANGASDLFVQLFEARGMHSRSISGILHPAGFSVSLTCSVTLTSLPQANS